MNIITYNALDNSWKSVGDKSREDFTTQRDEARLSTIASSLHHLTLQTRLHFTRSHTSILATYHFIFR